MDSYCDFSSVYDQLIDVDYSAWADYLCMIFNKNGVEPNLVLDLGCGTGSLTIEMAKRGYEMIGVDNSPDMLAAAKQKTLDSNLDIIYLNQDMSKFKLYGSVQAVISSLDSINYITDIRQFERLFRQVNFYLEPGGLFVFDVCTEHKLKNILGNNVYTYDNDDIFYVWENHYNKKSKICDYFLTFFQKNRENYSRTDEHHRQRLYTKNDISEAAAKHGLKLVSVFGDRTESKPKSTDERNFYVLSK